MSSTNRILLVALAVVVTLGVIGGGLHLYATRRVNGTLEQVAESVEVKHFAVLGSADADMRDWHIRFTVDNPSALPVEFSFLDTTVSADGESLGLMIWFEDWPETIGVSGTEEVTGMIRVWQSTYEELQAQEGETQLRFEGAMSASTSFLWVSQEAELPFEIDYPVYID